jgi:polar amino acid transport system permease protein
MTLKLSVLTLLIGSIVGFIGGLCCLSKHKFAKVLANCYSDFFRGTPSIVQLFVIYFAIPSILNFDIEPFFACLISFSLNTGAYVTEIVRGGIESIDKGQTEAGKCLGLSSSQIMWHIIFPQAIKRILPALGNEFIATIKETSIVGTIGLKELTREGQLIIASTYATFEIWATVALFYLVLIVVLTKILDFFERRLND